VGFGFTCLHLSVLKAARGRAALASALALASICAAKISLAILPVFWRSMAGSTPILTPPTPSVRAGALHSERVEATAPSDWPLLDGLRARLLVVALNGITLGLLGLHLWVRRFPPTPTPIPGPGDAESAWWGLWPVTTVPQPFVVAGTLLVLLAVAGALVWEWRRGGVVPAEGSPVDRRAVGALLVLLSLLLLAAFVAFPVVHTRWGDAYLISRAMAWPDPSLRLTHSWQAPLDVFLHSAFWHAFGPARGWETATPVYRILSPVAGGLYLVAAGGIALQRSSRMVPWFTWGLLATLGLLQLFFGYVENYSFAAAFILIYFWLALRVLDGRSPLWHAAAVLALTHALHPSTIVLSPSLLVLGYLLWRGGRGNNSMASPVYTESAAGAWRILLQIALPMLLVGIGTFLWMEWSGHGLQALMESDRPGGGDGRWFVPLYETTTRWEHYTLFSWLHLRDWLNLQLLVAPAVGPALMAALVVGWGRVRSRNQPALALLGTAAVAALAFSWLWNPDYGGQRDWDLFSLTTLPMTLLCALVLSCMLRGRRLWVAAGPLLLLQALHVAAWIHSNTLPWEWPS